MYIKTGKRKKVSNQVRERRYDQGKGGREGGRERRKRLSHEMNCHEMKREGADPVTGARSDIIFFYSFL